MNQRLRHLLFLLPLFFALSLHAQEPVDSNVVEEDDPGELVRPEINPDSKGGIKIGLGTTSMIGSAVYHSSPAMYLTGGLYYRFKFKKNWLFQPEALITYKGSNFNNGNGELGSIKAYYLEIPLMLMYGANENNTIAWGGGVQYSRQLNALLYQTASVVPEDARPAMNKDDLALILGGQFQTPFVGFQTFLKYGLMNVNNGLISTIGPNIAGKPMHHITFEISLFF